MAAHVTPSKKEMYITGWKCFSFFHGISERKTKYDFNHKGEEHSLLLMSFHFNHQKDCQETWQGNLFLTWF